MGKVDMMHRGHDGHVNPKFERKHTGTRKRGKHRKLAPGRHGGKRMRY